MAVENKSDNAPKTLLITGTPPGSHGVGEILQRDLVLHYGSDLIQCSAIVAPSYVWHPDPQLEGLAVQIIPSEYLRARRWGNGKWGAAVSFVNYLSGFRKEVRRLTACILEQPGICAVNRVFAALTNPLMLKVGYRVAQRLGVPLVTVVWDPPEYLLSRAQFDRLSRKLLLRDFRESLARSERIVVVSETMQEDYARLTGAPIRILRYGVPMKFDPNWMSRCDSSEGDWVIGFAGSMYADCAWRALLSALDKTHWKIAGRTIRLRLLTPEITVASRSCAKIEYLGYPNIEEMQEALRQCDMTYLPQPFAPQFSYFSRYSFPTKLTHYLAIGRPVMVHCPEDSALSLFYDAHPIGAKSTSLDSVSIVGALESLISDRAAYIAACDQAMAVARSHFDASVFYDAIDWLLSSDNREISLN